MNTFARSGAAALAAALTFTLAACGGTSSTATVPHGSMMTSPMMSGPASAMMSPPAAGAEHNAADLSFAQQMIVHHQGAVEMADLVPGRAAGQQVQDLAARIKAAQAPEIEQMTGWLTLWGAAMSTSTAATDDGTGGMDHGRMSGQVSTGPGMAMPGMMSDAQMLELTDATGADFDRLFLKLMIMHHQGAVEMADIEIAQGSNPAAVALAESIRTSQTAEITEMQQLLNTR